MGGVYCVKSFRVSPPTANDDVSVDDESTTSTTYKLLKAKTQTPQISKKRDPSKWRKKKETVNNIFIHFVSFSLEMKKKSLVMFLFFFFLNDCAHVRLWVRLVWVQSWSLLRGGIPLPTKRKKNSPNFSLKKVFPRNISSHASTLCIATGVWQ